MSALDCEKNGAFEYRCRQGHLICVTYAAARHGLDARVIVDVCDRTEPQESRQRRANAEHTPQTRIWTRGASRVTTGRDGTITRFGR